MTMHKNINGRKTILILLCTILVYSCACLSFLGPGLSAQAAMGTISATDVVTPIGGQEAEPMATASVQVYNVLVRVTMNRSDIGHVLADITGTGTAELHKYDCVDITPQQLSSTIRNR